MEILITIIVAAATAIATVKNVEETAPVVVDTTDFSALVAAGKKNAVYSEIVSSYEGLIIDLEYAAMHTGLLSPYNKGLIEGGLMYALEILEEVEVFVYDEASYMINERKKEVVKKYNALLNEF